MALVSGSGYASPVNFSMAAPLPSGYVSPVNFSMAAPLPIDFSMMAPLPYAPQMQYAPGFSGSVTPALSYAPQDPNSAAMFAYRERALQPQSFGDEEVQYIQQGNVFVAVPAGCIIGAEPHVVQEVATYEDYDHYAHHQPSTVQEIIQYEENGVIYEQVVEYASPANVVGDQYQSKTRPKAKFAINKAGPKGMVDKVKDKVHEVEDKVMGVEQKVMDKVHGVENAVSKAAGAAHSLFNLVGGLFHKGHDQDATTGPHGTEIGKGSTVETTFQDGTVHKGHIVSEVNSEGYYEVQLHEYPRGFSILRKPEQIRHVSETHPTLGSGVEVDFEGTWLTGYVIHEPCEEYGGRWAVQCHSDPHGEVCLARDDKIRPLLSDEEKAVVKNYMTRTKDAKVARAKAAEASKAAAGVARELQIEAQKQEAFKDCPETFKKKLYDGGFGDYYRQLVGEGFETERQLQHLQDEDLQAIGMKKGHIIRFHEVFPCGETYVVWNGALESKAKGLGIRMTKDTSGDVKAVAEWGSTVTGVDQGDGWLKVGLRYLPFEVRGKQVLYHAVTGPPGGFEAMVEPEASAPNPEEKKAGSGFFSGIFGSRKSSAPPGETPKGTEAAPTAAVESTSGANMVTVYELSVEEAYAMAAGTATEAWDTVPFDEAGSAVNPAQVVPVQEARPEVTETGGAVEVSGSGQPESVQEAPATSSKPKESLPEEAEGKVSSAIHGFAHLLHMDGLGSSKSATKSTNSAAKASGAEPSTTVALSKSTASTVKADEASEEGTTMFGGLMHRLHLR